MALAGSKDANSFNKWAREGGHQPWPKAIKRPSFVYEQRHAGADGEHVALVSFIGASPWLDDDTPVNAIREDRLKAVRGEDARTIERWLKPGVRLKVEGARLLRDAFHVFSLIEEADGAEVARAGSSA